MNASQAKTLTMASLKRTESLPDWDSIYDRIESEALDGKTETAIAVPGSVCNPKLWTRLICSGLRSQGYHIDISLTSPRPRDILVSWMDA